jgi:hypothetical protein
VLFSTSLLFEMHLLGLANLVSNQSDLAARTRLLSLIDDMTDYFTELGEELVADPRQAHLPPHSMADHIAMLTRCHQISTTALTSEDGQPPPPTWGNYVKFVEAASDGIRCYLDALRSNWSDSVSRRRPSGSVAQSIFGVFQETLG